MTEIPLPLAVQLGVERMNQRGTPFAPDQVRLVAELGMSSGLSGVIALPPGLESGQSYGGYRLVKFAAPQTSAIEASADDLWKCTKEHYGLTAAAALTGVGGVPISKLLLGHFVMPGSSQYTNLVSHYGHKFFPMAMLPRGSALARMAKTAFGTIRIFGIVGRTSLLLPWDWPSTTSSASGCAPMKNAMASRAMNLPSKDQVIETIIDIFVREIGFIDREAVSRATHVVKDFQIDTDDLSWFSAAVIKHFGLSVTPKEWLDVEPTIDGIADFVLRHLPRNP